MARIIGVDLPKEKRIDVALRYLYGIGPHQARLILDKAHVDLAKRTKDLTEREIATITSEIQKSGLKVEGDLRREVSQNIKRLMDIGCYRGLRHRKGLPVRGQRSHTNARTRKGPRKQIGAGIRKPAPAAS